MRKTRRAQRKKQKGGFYPSVYGAVANTVMLTPLAVRQGYKLLSSNTRKRKIKRNRNRRR